MNISGAENAKVPTLAFKCSFSSSIIWETPKSDNLALSNKSINIFSGFISLWTIPTTLCTIFFYY